MPVATTIQELISMWAVNKVGIYYQAIILPKNARRFVATELRCTNIEDLKALLAEVGVTSNPVPQSWLMVEAGLRNRTPEPGIAERIDLSGEYSTRKEGRYGSFYSPAATTGAATRLTEALEVVALVFSKNR